MSSRRTSQDLVAPAQRLLRCLCACDGVAEALPRDTALALPISALIKGRRHNQSNMCHYFTYVIYCGLNELPSVLPNIYIFVLYLNIDINIYLLASRLELDLHTCTILTVLVWSVDKIKFLSFNVLF